MEKYTTRIDAHLPELSQISSIIQKGGELLRVETITQSPTRDHLYPVYSIALGSEAADKPAIAFVGGIHGIERIGTQVVLSFLETLIQRAHWDSTLVDALEQVKLVFLPLMNPVGMLRNWRSNGNGVDLMRNAPIDAEDNVPWLVGGHRLSPMLPWYRGPEGAPMEKESSALIATIKKELFPSPFSLVVDCHSGFGFQDRIWFPYAYSKTERMPHMAEIYQLREMFFSTYPHQNYLFEPQSRHYTTHGDLWDYMYKEALSEGKTFLPLTLEMGSWMWVKKNPMQIRNALGMFHPMRPHRVRRVLRHHQLLMEFMVRATRSYAFWTQSMHAQENRLLADALWYE
ncbi:M14 family zinc carboxypeptidase [Alkalimarinus coralli]|uniref:M14 family zinc carboxypeptidase n=1 Tax=Alkalimarinus coralli TaxID=2935863 RepID=UPI00202BA044|nr:M14 family zinc carboxypeptidase [Alkalimarinus coralli]